MAYDVITRIKELKAERNAVVLAHNYQIAEIQDVADYLGDSLGLSQIAATTDADVIVFCGVHFMAETAKILSPEKTVLIPEIEAGCPMADMITAKQLSEFKEKHPDAIVVTYVNSTAEVKALSDYCCTSGNAVELVNRLPDDREIVFCPDRHLGSYVKEITGKNIILWPGYCPTHVKITVEEVIEAKQQNPDAIVMAHPECPAHVRDQADKLLSTGQMIQFAGESECTKFIIATEPGIIHTLKVKYPDKIFIQPSKAICPNMKKIDMGKLLWSLENMQYEVTVPEDIAVKAKQSLDRMLEVIPDTSKIK